MPNPVLGRFLFIFSTGSMQLLLSLTRQHAFCQVVRFCLQKNPKERPNCASLLSKKFFKRDLQPDAIVNELLVHVPVVGEGDVGLGRKEQGWVKLVVDVRGTTFSGPAAWFRLRRHKKNHSSSSISVCRGAFVVSCGAISFVVVQGAGGSACGGADDVGRQDRGKLKAVQVDDRNGGCDGELRPTKSEILLSGDL